ncbi:hypothetical protein ACVWZM_004582 [Bradyrhizobium sp. USDA 4501]
MASSDSGANGCAAFFSGDCSDLTIVIRHQGQLASRRRDHLRLVLVRFRRRGDNAAFRRPLADAGRHQVPGGHMTTLPQALDTHDRCPNLTRLMPIDRTTITRRIGDETLTCRIKAKAVSSPVAC